ncbi:hypothetical protein Zmor_021451 [Zophobas morio]|uniref:Uncharacterized protein n=1 Tax=Zophobas morio TaxID=2755281 RepID=A0AA38I668_9CUCU|nr:hypothetical protein Zmor_021451 [Zophobas morio]
MKTLILCVLFSLYTIPNVTQTAENSSNKLGDVLKNHTKAVYNSTKNQQDEEENLLKQETHKLLSECGVETSDNNYDDNDYYGNRRGSNKPRRGNNYDFGDSGSRRKNSNRRRNNNRDKSNESGDYGNSYNNRYGNRNNGNRYSNYDNDSDDDNDSNESNHRHGNRKQQSNSNKRYGNKRYNNENYSDEEESSESNQGGYNNKGMKRFNRTASSSNNKGYSNNNGYNNGNTYGSNGYNSGYSNGYNNDCKDENRGYYDSNNRNQWKPYGANEGNYGYDSGTYGYNSFGNNGNMRRGVSGPGYSRNFDINLRAKRSNNDEDSQCVSQCVFGYLEVLDDNRVPSETLVIKWLQDHLSNDMKRIRALREARRCFARLSTSDIEDGCEFSQSLSKCLNLELE